MNNTTHEILLIASMILSFCCIVFYQILKFRCIILINFTWINTYGNQKTQFLFLISFILWFIGGLLWASVTAVLNLFIQLSLPSKRAVILTSCQSQLFIFVPVAGAFPVAHTPKPLQSSKCNPNFFILNWYLGYKSSFPERENCPNDPKKPKSHYRTMDKQADMGRDILGNRNKHFWKITLPLGFFCTGTFKHLLHPSTFYCNTVITYQWWPGGICIAQI